MKPTITVIILALCVALGTAAAVTNGATAEPQPETQAIETEPTPEPTAFSDEGHADEWSDGGERCEQEKREALKHGVIVESCAPLRVWSVDEARVKGLL